MAKRRRRKPPPARRAGAPSAPKRRQEVSLILLEQFSRQNLATWRRIAGALQEYQTRLHHYLMGERSIVYRDLLECLRAAATPVIEFSDHWRIVDLRYSNEPLSLKGSLKISGRFNYGEDIGDRHCRPFPALYVAEDHETAQEEKFPTLANGELSGDKLALRTRRSYTAVRLHGRANTVLDVTKANALTEFARVLRRFRTPHGLKALARDAGVNGPRFIASAQELSQTLHDPNWRRNLAQFDLPSNSQVFGEIALDAGVAGIRYKSARGPGTNLVLFPQRFEDTESWCALQDEAGPSVEFARIDGGNWCELC